MKTSHSRAGRWGLQPTLLFALALAMWAAPARAVHVINVRVGQHEEFTRIVFDLDGPAHYHLERSGAGAAAPELLVHFDANAQPKSVRALSKVVDGVRLESGPEGAVARIALRSRDVHTVEETLSSPPRIVIDVRASTPVEMAAAKRSAGAPQSKAEAPPQAVATPPPQPAAAPPALARPVPRTTAEVIEAQADAAAARLLGEQGSAKPEAPVASAGPPPAPSEPAAPAESAAPPPAEPSSAPSAAAPAVQPEPPREAGNPQPGTLGAPPPHPPPAFFSPSGGEAWRFITGAVLIVLGLFVWFIFLRRRELKEDLHAGALPADAFLDRMGAFGDGTESGVEDSREQAEERTEPLPLFAGSSAGERTQKIPESETGGSRREEGSLFGDSAFAASADSAEKSVAAADLEHPSPALGERVVATLPTPHTDESMGRVLRDLEQRLAQIEQRLARDADARERVERQVVAQTEELRVQRAAIARTQRVLRTLSRPEDLATEPVIKSPGPSSGSPD